MPTDLSSWAQAALAASRASGAPPLAVLLGARRVRRTQADLELELDPDRPAATPLGPLDVAVLADLALGGALRARFGADRVLPTVSLTLHLAQPRPPADVRVRAWGDGSANGLADARAEVVAGGRPVGRALATFAVPARPGRAAPLPWEVEPEDHARPPQPTPKERRLAADLVRAAGDERSWAEELLLRCCRRDDHEDRELLCLPAPVLCNRAGHIQGGVLFGLAAAAVNDDPAPWSTRTAVGHILYVAPASAHAPVRAIATPIHETRRTRFVRVDLHQCGEVVATATFTLRTATRDR
jgi:acyl-coenzyme A thioesterase PaaI-like protein